MVICSKCNAEVDKYANHKHCKTCYNAKMKEYMKARYHRIRAEWIDKLGGICIDCGTDQGLEFDHVDAKSKKYHIGKIIMHNQAKVAAEMEKCVLRCERCHIEKSQREGDVKFVEHGGGVAGKKNCYCHLCAPLKREYARNWKRKNRMRR